ncbi:Transcription termination factor 2 [Trichostrongylus colubriformis]|uniref:Transcription termination factor 2 n=1 Tax=Trichostrongylus colubriformis TaxID=6319 RepID=A0AAN8FGW9_TRICO
MHNSFRHFKAGSTRAINEYLSDDDDESDDSYHSPGEVSPQSEPILEEGPCVFEATEHQSSSNSSLQEIVCSTPLTPTELVAPSGTRTIPFTSTPKSAFPQTGATLSESLASLTVDDDDPYGSHADRSRSFIGRTDSAESLSPFSARLATDPTSKGKLRDRVLRKLHSKSRSNVVSRSILPRSNLGKESLAVRNFEPEKPEIVEESIMMVDDSSSESDDIVVVNKNNDAISEISANRGKLAQGDVEPDVITIDSSSSDEDWKPPSGAADSIEAPSWKSNRVEEVKVVKTVSKFSHDTTGVLESKLANLDKLTSRPLALPDGGEKLLQHIEDLSKEIEIRKQRPKSIKNVATETTAEQQPTAFPVFNERRPLPPSLLDVLMDAQRPVYRNIHEKALLELHKSLTSQPDAQQLTETPEGLTVPLKEHQMSGLTWMKWRESLAPRGGILADEMGLGKTLSMIALIVDGKLERRRRKRDGNDEEDKERRKRIRAEGLIPSNATLVVAPAALIYHWETEIKARCEDNLLRIVVYHGPRKNVQTEMLARADVVISTYTIVANELERILTGRGEIPLAEIHWARIVLDEAHAVKNRRTKASKAVCQLAADARWCVTGTPLHNNLWDLYSLIKFLKVDYFNEEPFWKEYVASGTKKSAERLNLLMRNYVLRREKNFLSPLSEKPLVDLPKKHSHEHILQFSESERKAYDLMYEASRAKVKEMMTEEEVEEKFGARSTKKTKAPLSDKNVFIGSAANSNPNTKFGRMGCMLVILLRLRQACIHFHLTKNAVDMEAFQSIGSENPLTPEERENLANIAIENFMDPEKMDDITYIFRRKFVSAKIQLALDLLTHILNDGEKCVIVSQWTSFLKILEKHIKKRFPEVNCSTISGEVVPFDRQDRVNSFNGSGNGINVMLVSITAGGVGLNLTGGNHLILMDLHWNPALELQASDRIHRIGQTKEVHLHKIIMKGTIEERVWELQKKKMELADSVLKGAVSKKNMNLTMADLKYLFDLDTRK